MWRLLSMGCSKVFGKKVVAAILMIIMALNMTVFNVDAASVTTNVYSSSGPYTYYVREAGSATLLGTMYMHKTTSAVYNQFTASKACGKTTVYVSETNGGFSSKYANSLSVGSSVIVQKNVLNPTKEYGYCTVNY